MRCFWNRWKSPNASRRSRSQRSSRRQRHPEWRPSRNDRLRKAKLRGLFQPAASGGNLSSLRCAPEPAQSQMGFSKRLLSQGCEQLGIQYEPLPELSIESKHRAGLSGRPAYNRLFARYEATTLPRCQDAVNRIAGWIDAGERVAITCYERDSRDCHRSRLATAIVRTASGPLLPRHL